MMTQRRKFTAEFKARVVLDLVSGAKSAAELCREHQLNPKLLARWKTEFLERAPLLFEQEAMQSQEQERIAELERVVIDRPGVRADPKVAYMPGARWSGS